MTEGSGAAAPKPRVLVVDDDPHILDFLGLALEDEGFEVETAVNGAAALERLDAAARLSAGRPEVIILDLWMPVMDGTAFLKAYRERPGPRAPVIALTAAHYDAARSSGVEADGFLTKPFSLEELIELVRRFVAMPEAPA